MMLKNVRWWEWLIVGLVAIIVFFPKMVMKFMVESNVDGSVIGERRVKGQRSWFRRTVQSLLPLVPGGSIIGGIWDTIWP